LICKKEKDPTLLKFLRALHNAGKKLHSLDQLEAMMDSTTFNKLIRGIEL
jgi:hypothetical protein